MHQSSAIFFILVAFIVLSIFILKLLFNQPLNIVKTGNPMPTTTATRCVNAVRVGWSPMVLDILLWTSIKTAMRLVCALAYTLAFSLAAIKRIAVCRAITIRILFVGTTPIFVGFIAHTHSAVFSFNPAEYFLIIL